jgi:uncharacterized membrane protein
MGDTEVYAGAAAIGAVAGLRSMTAPALISHLTRSALDSERSKLDFLNSMVSMRTTLVLAVGELIADKLPFVPARTKAPSLIIRAVSGGLSGAALCSAKKRSWFAGALIGAGAAIGASYAAYELRKRAGRHFHLPDPVIAIVEDGIAAGAGALVLSTMR